MLNNITNIVRSNKNAVMVRIGNGCASSAIYTIFDTKTQTNTYTGSLDTCKAKRLVRRDRVRFLRGSTALHTSVPASAGTET